jgi:hypothetical protein
MKHLFAAACLLVLANANAQELAERIPKTATMVMTVNPGPHISNGDIASIAKLKMFTGGTYMYDDSVMEPARKVVTDIFSKPAETGVDQTKKIFLFYDVTDSITGWTYLVPLANGSTFKTYLTTKLFSEAPTVESGFGFEFVHKQNLDIAFTSGFAMIMLADYNRWYYDYGMDYAVTAIAEPTEQMDTAAAEPVLADDSTQQARIREMEAELAKMNALEGDSLRAYVERQNEVQLSPYELAEQKQQQEREQKMAGRSRDRLRYYMSLLPADAITSNRNFRTIQAEPFEAAFWYNYGEQINRERNRRYDMFRYNMMVDTTQQEKRLWDDSYFVALARFQGNEMVVTQHLYLSPKTTLETKGMYHGKVKKKMFRYVKSPNLMGYAALSMNSEKLMKFGGTAYRDAMSYYNSMTQGLVFTSWDIARVFVDDDVLYNLFSGDMLFAVTDLRPFTASYVTYDYDENFNRTEVRQERTEIMPEFVGVVSIGKTKEAQEILNIIEKARGIRKEGTDYYAINMPGTYEFKTYIALHKGLLIITNNEELMKDRLKKGYSGSEGMSRKQVKDARRSPLMAYWDSNKSLELMEKQYGEKMSKREKQLLADMRANVSRATLAGTRPQDGVQTAVLRVSLNDSKENGLIRFFKIMDMMYRF